MNHRTCLAAVVVAFGAVAGAPASAGPVAHEIGPNLVTNGGFETGDFSGWTASVDPVFSGVDPVAAHSGSFGAFLGDFGTPGSLAQSLATVAGTSYDIHLWLRSDGLSPNAFQVFWGGVSVYSATDLGPFPYVEIVIDPQATSGSTLLELRARDDNGFLELDDVSVRAVPEPLGLALFVPGLAGVIALRRKNRRTA